MYNVPTTLTKNTLLGAARLNILEEDYTRLAASSVLDSYIMNNVIISPGEILLDLIITDVTQQIADFNKVESHLADTFSIDYFGASPVTLSISAKLIDTYTNNAKKVFTTLYEKLFRISKVAKHKIVPFIQFLGCSAFGTFLNLNLSEQSSGEDYINCTFDFLVFNLYFINLDNTGYAKFSEINFSGSSPIPSLGL